MDKQGGINKKSGPRVKALLKESGMTQEQLAEKLGFSGPQQVSYIVTGRRNLTERNARIIATLFPGVRVDWLLGRDDFRTLGDLFKAEFLNERQRIVAPADALDAYLSRLRYSIVRNEEAPPALDQDASAEDFQRWEKALTRRAFALKTDAGDVVAYLSPDECTRLADDIFDFVQMKLLKLQGKWGFQRSQDE